MQNQNVPVDTGSSRTPASNKTHGWQRDVRAILLIVSIFVVRKSGWRGEVIFPLLYLAFRLHEDWSASRVGLGRTLFHVVVAILLGVAVFYIS